MIVNSISNDKVWIIMLLNRIKMNNKLNLDKNSNNNNNLFNLCF